MSDAWRTAVLQTFLSFHKILNKEFTSVCIIICFQEIEIVGIVPMDYTTPDKAVLASVFNLAEHPVFTAYNRTRTAVAMDGRTVQIKSKKWPKIHLYLNANFDLEPNGVQRGVNYIYSVTVSKKHTIQSCFTFKKVRDDDIFTCESIFHRKKIGSTEESNFGIAHNTDELKLIRLFEMNGDMDQQLYLIALVKSPAKFVFCTDNKSWFRDEYPSLKEGDPGEQGYWYLDQAGAENARPRSECSVSYIT